MTTALARNIAIYDETTTMFVSRKALSRSTYDQHFESQAPKSMLMWNTAEEEKRTMTLDRSEVIRLFR